MIDVIIHAYRGLAETRRAIESVLASRVTVPHEITVIDDASPEPALCAWLRELAASGRIEEARRLLAGRDSATTLGLVLDAAASALAGADRRLAGNEENIRLGTLAVLLLEVLSGTLAITFMFFAKMLFISLAPHHLIT